MKSVLISIKPKWCELIVKGEKTVEVRKTRPKIETPFKGYIYCTKNNDKDIYDVLYLHTTNGKLVKMNGKVVGEFVCDAIFPISIEYSNTSSTIAQNEFPYTGMTDKEIIDYLGNGKTGYGCHISALKIYDEPKELSEFEVKRPPQSWCYVKEI